MILHKPITVHCIEDFFRYVLANNLLKPPEVIMKGKKKAPAKKGNVPIKKGKMPGYAGKAC